MSEARVPLELVASPTVVVDRSLRVVEANAAARELVPGAELRSLDQLLADDRASLVALVRRMLRSTSPVPGQATPRSGDRTSARVTGCRARDGEAIAILRLDVQRPSGFAALTDTIARMNAEIARRRDTEAHLHTLLTTTVADLETSNAMLRRFAGGTAHDLKTPLATIAGFAEFARSHPELPDELHEVCDRMESAARRGSALVDDLLQEALRASEHDQPVPVDVGRALDEVLALLSEALVGHALTHDELPVVMGRHVALRQVLLNLVSNAIRHHGGGRARIHVDAVGDRGTRIVRVHDDGPGIPVAAREAVFRRGVRLDADAPGTGLGLAHCRSIVEGLGGRLFVDESGPLGGATVAIQLSAADAVPLQPA